MSIIKETPWVDRFQPQTVEETILPSDTKKILQNLMKDPKSMPDLLFAGPAGIGKTTTAEAMMREMDADYLKVKAAMEGDINTLRTKIQEFASKVSMTNDRKFVIFDEADSLNRQSTQPALRNFMDEFRKNCCFIATCNNKHLIIDPVISRFSEVSFKIPAKEKASILKQVLIAVFKILQEVGVEFDKKAVAEHVQRFSPDLRKTLVELQSYSRKNGKIDIGILSSIETEGMEELFALLKQRSFSELVTWTQKYDNMDIADLNAKIYAKAESNFGAKNLPQIILHMSEYDYKDKFVSNKQINILAMLTEIMRDLN